MRRQSSPLRAGIARRLLSLLIRRTPEIVRRLETQVLADLAAKSFGIRKKPLWLLPADRALEEYAACTRDAMRQKGQETEPEDLYRRAFLLGRRIRRITGFSDREDLEKLVFYLYRNIRISMEGEIPGQIAVSSCYFSGVYSPEECRLMSNADSGIIAGIFGGGRLSFTERITEGCPCCRACFRRRKPAAERT